MRRAALSSLLIAMSMVLGLPVEAAAQDNPFASCAPDANALHFQGNKPEPIPDRPGAIRITLFGQVSIVCNDTTLFADEIVYENDTRKIWARGNVALQQADLQVYAERAEMDGRTRLGTFFNATGSASIANRPTEKSMFGTLEPDVMFYGQEISKVGPKTYTIKDGGFTTCVQPAPRWAMTAGSGTITLDRRAVLKHVVLRVKNVPLLYLPAMYYPINKEDRSSGLLLPSYGSSTILGSSISNALFLALGRSHDATLYHDWYPSGGQGMGAEYRYVAGAESRGTVRLHLLNEKERELPGGSRTEAGRSFDLRGEANQILPGDFRVIAGTNYFTSARTNQYDTVNYGQQTRGFRASVNGTISRLRLTGLVDLNDLFYGDTPGRRFGNAPSVTATLGDRPIGRSRVYYGASGSMAYLLDHRNLSDATTNRNLMRFDGGSSIRTPLSNLPYLSATATASLRLTRWLESMDPVTGLQVTEPLNRRLLSFSAQVTGPVLARVFQTPDNGYAERFKHVIEPTFRIERNTAFNERDRVVIIDGSDGLVGGTTTLRYGVTNRLLARRKSAPAAPGAPAPPGIVRDILSVEIGQNYYSDPNAGGVDPLQPTRTTASFSPVQVTAITRPTDSTSGQFRMQIDPKSRTVATLSGSGTYDIRIFQVTGGWSKQRFILGHPDYTLVRARESLDISTSLRTADNSMGGSYSFHYDVNRKFWGQQRVLAYYNTQCCGVAFDYAQTATPIANYPTNRQFGISFTLAGIGSFANPLGTFGGR